MSRLLRGALSDAAFYGRRVFGRAAGLRVLMYHRVTDAHPEDRLCVRTAAFERQMQWLHERGYRTMPFGQAVEWVKNGEDSAGRGAGGEGRASGVRSAKCEVRSDDARPTETLRTPNSELRTIHPVPAESLRRIVLTFDDGFEDNFLHAYPAMARRGFTGCFFVPSGFIQAEGRGVAEADRPMSRRQLEELLRQGQEIGGHSVTHRKLTTIKSRELPEEIGGCKQWLEQRLGRPVDYFCYPAGDYNSLVRHTVQSCGYLGACTVEPGGNGAGADPFLLKRTEISAFDTLWDFEKKLAGAYDWLHRLVQARHR